MKRTTIKLILLSVFIALLIILFFPRDYALASSSYFRKVDARKVDLYFPRSDEKCLMIELVLVECIVENDIVVEKVVRRTLEKLFRGPTEQERERLDLWTALPKNIKINSIRIEDKTIFLDLSKEFNLYGGGATNVICMIEQFKKTLEQFSIEEVVITVEGKDQENGVLQP